MELHKKIIGMLSNLTDSYRNAITTKIDFNEASSGWTPEWTVRCEWLNKAEKIDRDLRPHINTWRKTKTNYGVDIQNAVQKSTDCLVDVLHKLQNQTSSLQKKLFAAHSKTKSELNHTKAYPAAIASYSQFS